MIVVCAKLHHHMHFDASSYMQYRMNGFIPPADLRDLNKIYGHWYWSKGVMFDSDESTKHVSH